MRYWNHLTIILHAGIGSGDDDAAPAPGSHVTDRGPRGYEMRPDIQTPRKVHPIDRNLLQVAFDLIAGMRMQHVDPSKSVDNLRNRHHTAALAVANHEKDLERTNERMKALVFEKHPLATGAVSNRRPSAAPT